MSLHLTVPLVYTRAYGIEALWPYDDVIGWFADDPARSQHHSPIDPLATEPFVASVPFTRVDKN